MISRFYKIFQHASRNSIICFILAIAFTQTVTLIAQDDLSGEIEKATSRLNLTITQMPGDSIELSALLRAKIEGVYQKIPDVAIEFTTLVDGAEKTLGTQSTNERGIALLTTTASEIILNEEGYLTFGARFSGDRNLEDSDDETEVLSASITLEPQVVDSLYTILVKLSASSSSGDVPLEEADVIVFAKRLFSQLKIGEGTTDENGEISIAIPSDLPGDNLGNLYLTVQVEDFDEYGNLRASLVTDWGKPVSTEIGVLPRALWSPNPPVWMIVTFFVLMTAVWGHYIVIGVQLYLLRKEGGTG